MSQASFAYSPPANYADDVLPGVMPGLSLFADRGHLRDTMRDDAQAAGFRILASARLADLHEGGVQALGDVIVVDCPQPGGAELAALSRLDMRAARSGAHLVVSTSVAGLDDVFACLDQSGAQILVDPSRAERLVALGRALAEPPAGRVRELAESDRMALLRLTEQVSRLAERLDRLSVADNEPARVEAPRTAFAFGADSSGDRLVRTARPPLPDPRMVRRMIRQRQLRARFFDGELFADPAWDMLLDLIAAQGENVRVSVTSLCIASGVPPTTALRWIGQMTEAGLFERVLDECDRRRAFINLTDRASDGMARYFDHIGADAAHLV